MALGNSSIADSVNPGNQYFRGNNAGFNREGRRQSGQKSADKRNGSRNDWSIPTTPELSNSFNASRGKSNKLYLAGSWHDASGKEVGWMCINLSGSNFGPYATIN